MCTPRFKWLERTNLFLEAVEGSPRWYLVQCLADTTFRSDCLSTHLPAHPLSHLPDALRTFPITLWIDWDSPPLTVPTPWAHILNWSACLSPPPVLGAPSGQEVGHAHLWTPFTGTVPSPPAWLSKCFYLELNWGHYMVTHFFSVCRRNCCIQDDPWRFVRWRGKGVFLNKTSTCEYRCILLTRKSPVDLFLSLYARLFLLFPFS